VISARPGDRNRVQCGRGRSGTSLGVAVSEVNSIDLEGLSRDDLIARAAGLGVVRPELMTRVELRDEIIRLSETDEQARKRARGWLGVARDLVASVVEQRLNLPDAAELIRGFDLSPPRNIPPVATVTLAEIYAAQGHMGRAIKLLDEVLLREPDHEAAMALRTTLVRQQGATAEGTAVESPIEASELAGFEPVTPTQGEPIIVEPEIAAESLEVVAAAAAAAEATAAAAAEAEAVAAAAAAAEAEAVRQKQRPSQQRQPQQQRQRPLQRPQRKQRPPPR
jgi:hypothetical protein